MNFVCKSFANFDKHSVFMASSIFFSKDVQGVKIITILDTRRAYNLTEDEKQLLELMEKQGDEKEAIQAKREELLRYPLAIRVTYNRKLWYYKTGDSYTLAEFDNLRNANKKGKWFDKQKSIGKIYDNISNKVEELKNANNFSLKNLAAELGDKKVTTKESLMIHWKKFAESKDKLKTKEQYLGAYKSFFIANGANQRTDDNGKKVLYGRVLEMMPDDIKMTHIEKWYAYMDSCGNSSSTKSIYLRAFRALLNHLKFQEIIDNVPKLTIPKSTRREDNFLTVDNILKLRDYVGDYKQYADWWLIIYLCNGANLRDLATLTWGDNFSTEFTFVRSKTAGKSPSLVHIPITDLLTPYLEKYASTRVKGQRVFPQILLDATSERAISNRVHDFNANIRNGLINVCEALQMPVVSAAWARNSYITTLTWHGISDAFIDDMVGHTDGKVLAGYQGKISPKKRMQINSLLFTNPEEDM